MTEVIDEVTHKRTLRKYDKFNHLEEETLSNGLTLSYAYDQMGRVKSVQLPDQSAIDYVYDACTLNQVQRKINNKIAYLHQNFSHNLAGKITRAKIPGHTGELYYHYDAVGRCSGIQSLFFNQEIPFNGFDPSGNLLKFTAQRIDYAFTYDDHYHLASESGHQNHSYRFDSLANRIEKDQELHVHNALNQVTKKGTETFVYDLNGNLTQREGVRHTYDALDRLIQVNQQSVLTTYTYDPFNRRMSKKQANNEQLFLYQDQEEIGSWVDGALQELRLIVENCRQPMVALELNSTPFVPIHDLSNNVVCLLNLQGEVVERYRYTAFGETEISTPTGKQLSASFLHNPYQYASKRLDLESGLIAFGLRFYDPSLGRWLTPDPAGDADGPNLYTYVHNSPLLHFDHFGLFSDDFDCSWDPVFPTYFIASGDDIHHGFAGAFHGGLDFAACQVAGIGSMCCSIGVHEWDDHQERHFSTLAFNQSCASHINRFDCWFVDTLRADSNNVIYQNFHSLTQTSMEIGSLTAGGYGLIKGGIKGVQFAILSRQMEKFAGELALNEIKFVAGSGAENVNAGINLSKKLSGLESAKAEMARFRLLADGRIRYYDSIRAAKKSGSTAGASYVTEYNPKTGSIRSWNECYDQFGNVNRIHPKTINGQIVNAIHYPPLLGELLP